MWYSLRVNYHEPDKKALLLDSIQPVVDSLREGGAVQHFYYTRHWLRGPHIQLNFYCEESLFQERVRPLVMEQVGTYLSAHPSATQSEDELRAHHEQLAKMEMITESLFPFLPNNTVLDMPYSGHSKLGDEGSRLHEKYHAETSDLVFRLLGRARADENALLPDLIKVMIAVIANVKDVRRTYLSFRSHSEIMLHTYDKTGGLRQHFQQQYEANREPIKALIATMVQEVQVGETGVEPLFKEWVAFLRDFNVEVQSSVEQGLVRPPLPEDHEEFYQEHGVPDGWVVEKMSEFHDLFYSQDGIDEVLSSTLFKSFRLMLNYLYSTFAQLGIKPMERYYLGFLVANGVEELYSVHWKTQLAKTE